MSAVLVGESSKSLGADQLKALYPMVVKLADGVKSWMVKEECERVCGYG